jgi:sarcosine oxidase
MTPPIQYPDGDYYIKMGANTIADQWPTTLAEIQAWFREGDSDLCKGAMEGALRSQFPEVEFLSFESKRCIVCYTPSRHATIDEVGDGIFVAAGGNGRGAKGSDTLGYLAAGLIHDGSWPHDIPRGPFRASIKIK